MDIELPNVINTQMGEEEFRRAVQQNLDHIIGVTRRNNDTLDELVGGPAGNPQALEDAVNQMDISASDPAVYTVLNDAGVGEEDGLPPQDAPANVRAIGGIGNWFLVRADGVANTSGVTYEIHVSTVNGFTPAANTKAGEIRVPGGANNVISFLVRDFPTGHVLDGTGADPVNTTTTYYVVVVPVDGDGSGPASAQVSVTAMTIDASSVLAAGTIVANLIGASEITGGKISAGAVTAGHISVGSLSAISANVGTLTAGTIRGVKIESSSGTDKVVMDSSVTPWLVFEKASALAGIIGGGTTGLFFADSSSVTRLQIQGSAVEVVNGASLTVNGTAVSLAGHGHAGNTGNESAHTHSISNPGAQSVTGTSGTTTGGTLATHTHTAGSYSIPGHGHGGATGGGSSHNHSVSL
jgi:hypothetical protein